MASTMMGSVWYLDSAALPHMTGNIEFLSEMDEKYLSMYIEMGGDKRYNMTGIGMVTFDMD